MRQDSWELHISLAVLTHFSFSIRHTEDLPFLDTPSSHVHPTVTVGIYFPLCGQPLSHLCVEYPLLPGWGTSLTFKVYFKRTFDTFSHAKNWNECSFLCSDKPSPLFNAFMLIIICLCNYISMNSKTFEGSNPQISLALSQCQPHSQPSINIF